MSLHPHRFQVSLEDLEDSTIRTLSLVPDVKERVCTSTPRPPSAAPTTTTGFPSHKRRVPSKFKQRRAESESVSTPSSTAFKNDDHGVADDKRVLHDIREENKRRIANMTDTEIEREREELMQSLSPTLLQKLLQRANVDEEETRHNAFAHVESAEKKKKVAFADTEIKPPPNSTAYSFSPDDAPLVPPSDLMPASASVPSMHFPHPPDPPALDPDSPSFLTDLHAKYFPTLPLNPAALSWMSEPLELENAAYSPTRKDLPVKNLRFDFHGRLLSPKKSMELPVTKGLHHHGDAPGAAGYTISEIGMLMRSSVTAQRCIAVQTAGRILYRLGTKRQSCRDIERDLLDALWQTVQDEHIVEVLVELAAKDNISTSLHAYAIEAVWLWRRGGGDTK